MRQLDREKISLVCPQNDGESAAIIEIARRLSIDVRVSSQPWGATLDKEPPQTFWGLKLNLVIVEIPGPEKEDELRKEHGLFIIDHHKYPGLDRSNPRSSLEQFADIVDYKLSRREKGIALNDRGYIFALRENGFNMEEIREIRKFDLMAQGLSDDDFDSLAGDYYKGFQTDRLYVVHTGNPRNSYLSDLHFYENERRNEKLDLVVLLLGAGGKKVEKASFSGDPAMAKKLFENLGGFSGGDARVSMYWGKETQGIVSPRQMLDEIVRCLTN